MRYKNIYLIGTSHIARQSLEEIEAAFNSFHPDVVAVELDKRRLYGLLSDEKTKVSVSDIRRIGVKGYLFALIGGYLQRKLGNIVGVSPGAEMKLAVELARKNNAKIALVDQDIEITLRKLSQRITWTEKFRFVADIFKELFFKKKALKELGISDPRIDLSKVPDKELVKNLIRQFERRYPNVHDVLVTQRNRIMANNLARCVLRQPDDKLLVVIGAGHEEELFELLKKRLEGKADIVA
ncbi:TraB/GumN family protein [Candidatus Woesearchaeota archaeon]|nr:TraB/GumN family protein [Candidatus Woesearchaeota archaeon]